MNRATLTGATVQRKTARAVLVQAQGRAVWLPLALVSFTAAGLSLPAWLAQDRGLTVEAPPAPAAAPAPRRYVGGYATRGMRLRAELAACDADNEAPRGSADWRRAYDRSLGAQL